MEMDAFLCNWLNEFYEKSGADEVNLEIESISQYEIVFLCGSSRIKFVIPENCDGHITVNCDNPDDDFVASIIYKMLSNMKTTCNKLGNDVFDVLGEFQACIISVGRALQSSTESVEEQEAYQSDERDSEGKYDYGPWFQEHSLRKKLLQEVNQLRAIKTLNNNNQNEIDSVLKTNMFTAEASANLLVTDLLSLKNESETSGYSVDPVDNNIFRWRVLMENFPKGSNIASELIKLENLWG